MREEADRALHAARRRARPRPGHRGTVDRRPADHRDRQGHLARRAGAHHGRADRRTERRRGRATLRGRPQPARRGPRAAVHLAPLRRGLRAVRHRHRDARRLVHRHHPIAETTRRRARPPDGRPRCDRPVPQAARRDRRGRAGGRGTAPARACSATSRSPCAPARSSGSPVSSAPGAARSLAPCSASTCTRAAP